MQKSVFKCEKFNFARFFNWTLNYGRWTIDFIKSLNLYPTSQVQRPSSIIERPIMRIFKFGGASLRDTDNIKNVTEIIRKNSDTPLGVVVSAIGKTTNALEEVVRAYFAQNDTAFDLLNKVREQHESVMHALFDKSDEVWAQVNDLFVEAEWVLEDVPHDAYDYIYDQIVSLGELLSSRILTAYLKKEGVKTLWLDARDVLRTDDTWREAVVDWQATEKKIKENVLPKWQQANVIVTQGFIGSTKDNNTTTLGREGSDFSAAIFAHCLDAESMSIWKDVDGVYAGDPRVFKNVKKLEHIGFDEAVEMTYYGATVVHPRTIQPLMAKNIPLHVRSFTDHDAAGTVIDGAHTGGKYPPIFTVERDQVFLKLSNKDFSFLVEAHIAELFGIFAKHRIFVNLMQNSGAYFFVSITHSHEKENTLMTALKDKFNVEVESGMELFTVRHPTPEAIKEISEGKKIVFEKSLLNTTQILMEKPD